MSDPAAAARRPLVIGHRGDCAAYPENTRISFDAALAGGADGVELDLRPTGDGGVVVCHDASLRRFRGSWRPLARQTLEELATHDVGSWFDARFHDQRLLTIDALLAAYAGRTQLLLELKAAAGIGAKARNRRLCRATVEAIGRHGAERSVMILCFSSQLLAQVAELNPHLRLVRNCMRRPSDPARWLAGQPRLHGVDFDRRVLTRRLVAQCQAQGLKVFTWNCNTPAAYAALQDLGLDGILSDRPAWLREQVHSHG